MRRGWHTTQGTVTKAASRKVEVQGDDDISYVCLNQGQLVVGDRAWVNECKNHDPRTGKLGGPSYWTATRV